jgi:hypothetical protein
MILTTYKSSFASCKAVLIILGAHCEFLHGTATAPSDKPFKWDTGKSPTPTKRPTTDLVYRAFHALLGLQPCLEIAWALIRYKDVWGHKIIRSITVFQPTPIGSGPNRLGYHDVAARPALVLELCKPEKSLLEDAELLEVLYSDDRGITALPEWLCEPIGLDEPPRKGK